MSMAQLFSATQDPVAGERLFSAKGCAGCHAVNGVGGKIGPDVGRAARPRTFFDLAADFWNHVPKMAERMRQAGIARPRLDARETGDLAAYLYTLNYFDRAGTATAGRRLFADKHCADCHSIGGKGGGQGPGLGSLGAYASPIAIAAAMWNHAPRMATVMTARGIQRPTFEGSQLLDLIAYLKAASPRPKRAEIYVLPGSATNGRLLFADKRCAVCHAIVKRGDEEAPDLVEGQAQRSLTQFATAMWNKAPAMLRAMEAKQGFTAERAAGRDGRHRGVSVFGALLPSVGPPARRRDPRREQGLPRLSRALRREGQKRERPRPGAQRRHAGRRPRGVVEPF